MSWINVEDELPQKEGIYLVYAPCLDEDKPLIVTTWFNLRRRRWELVEAWAEAVTHWQPLPSPPEEPKTPSNEKLLELAKKHPPPQEWYEEQYEIGDLTKPELYRKTNEPLT